MKSKSLKINSILNIFRSTVSMLFQLITFPYVSRIFSAEGIGKIDFVKSVINVFCIIASLGIYTYGVREGSKFRNDKEKFSKFTHEMLIINLISTVIVYIVLIISCFIIPKFVEVRFYIILYGISIGFMSLGLDWVYGVYEDYLYISVRQIIVQLISLLSMFIFVKDSTDLTIYVVILLVSNVGSNIFNLIKVNKYVSFGKIGDYNIKIHLLPIFILFAYKIATSIYSSVDTLMLGFLANDRAVGLYSAGIKLNNIIVTLFMSMNMVVLPRLVIALSNNEQSQYYALINKLIKLIFLLGVPSVLGICFNSYEISYLLGGADFVNAKYTMSVLSPIIVIISVTSAIQNAIFIPYKKESYVLISTVTGAVINIILNSFLIYFFTEIGASIGSVFSELVVLLITIFLNKKLGINNRRIFKGIGKYFIAALVIIPITYLVKGLELNLILGLLLSVGLSVVSYFGILFLIKDEILIEGLNIFKLINKK